MTSTHVSRIKTSRFTRTHARSTIARRGSDAHPKLGNFFRVAQDVASLGLEVEVAIRETRPGSPPSSPPTRSPDRVLLLLPLSPEELLKRAANYDTLASGADDSPVSTVDDDSHGLSEDVSVGVPVSPATAATSVEDSIVEVSPLLPDPCVGLTSSLPSSSQLPSVVGVTQQFPSVYHAPNASPQINWDEYHLTLHHLNLSNAHRIKLAQLADTPRTSSLAEKLSLPWDREGRYTSDLSHQNAGFRKAISHHVIEPLYRVDKQLQLGILSAWLESAVCHDDLSRSINAASNQPVHVFVDMSNIIIGFCKRPPCNNLALRS